MSALPGLGTTLVRGRRWQKSPVTGESAKETVKTIACGNAGRLRCTRCYSCAFYHYQVHTRPRVQRAPGIPHALFGREISCIARAHRAARAKTCHESVIARSEADEALHSSFTRQDGFLRGACHRARIRATRWLAMTNLGV